jgi:hypothetical protein
MNESELESIAGRLQDRILTSVQTAERLRAVEVQTQRIASDLESEKATRARVNEKMEQRLEKLGAGIEALNKSNWTAAGAVGAAFVLWDVAKHFIKF